MLNIGISIPQSILTSFFCSSAQFCACVYIPINIWLDFRNEWSLQIKKNRSYRLACAGDCEWNKSDDSKVALIWCRQYDIFDIIITAEQNKHPAMRTVQNLFRLRHRVFTLATSSGAKKECINKEQRTY